MAASLTVLGLGPGNPDQRTLEAVASLASAPSILLRTGIHPGLDDLLTDPRVATCDDLYDTGRSFDEVYAAIVDRVLRNAAEGPLVFAVPGHPLIGERTVPDVLRKAHENGISVQIVAGLSAIDVVSGALRVDPMSEQAQLVDGTELQRYLEHEPFSGSLPDISPLRPVLLTQVYSHRVASAAKLVLARVFPDDHPIVVVTSAGVPGEEGIERRRLFELDRMQVAHLTSVWVPRLSNLDATRWPVTLHQIVARLRAPDGCPWDRKQTYATLRDAAIEEAYEVAAAIDTGDVDHLAEELGDLLLLVAMQAQIGEEAGDFSAGDILDHVNRKLVRRHPHVFGDVLAETPEAVVRTWNEVKADERAAKGLPPMPIDEDPFDRFPTTMPVMLKIAKIARGKEQSDDDTDPARELGEELLRVVERIAGHGLNPEQELERAYRQRRAERMIDLPLIANETAGSH